MKYTSIILLTILNSFNIAQAVESQVLRIACFQTIEGGDATSTGFVVFEQDNNELYDGSELMVENEVNLPESDFIPFKARLFQTVKMPANVTDQNVLQYTDALLDSSNPHVDIPAIGRRSFDVFTFYESEEQRELERKLFVLHTSDMSGRLTRLVSGQADSRSLKCFKPFLVKKSPAPSSAPILADGSGYETADEVVFN